MRHTLRAQHIWSSRLLALLLFSDIVRADPRRDKVMDLGRRWFCGLFFSPLLPELLEALLPAILWNDIILLEHSDLKQGYENVYIPFV